MQTGDGWTPGAVQRNGPVNGRVRVRKANCMSKREEGLALEVDFLSKREEGLALEADFLSKRGEGLTLEVDFLSKSGVG